MAIGAGPIFDPGFHTATVGNGQILAHVLTTGVGSFQYAAPQEVTGIVVGGEGLFLATDLSTVWAASQLVGLGRITVMADSNTVNFASFDNDIFYLNLLSGAGPGPGGEIPEPTTLVVWSLLGALGGVFGWRRRRR